MKRPTIWFAVAFTLCTLIELRFSLLLRSYPSLGLALVAVALATILCEFRKTAPIGVLLSGAICGLLLTYGYTQLIVRPIEALAERSFEVQAIVADYPEQYEEEQLVLLQIEPRFLGLSATRPKVRTLAYLPHTAHTLQPGDRLNMTLSFYHTEVSDGFASKSYYAGNGIFVRSRFAEQSDGTALPITIMPTEKLPLWCYPLAVANGVANRITKALPSREAGLTIAILVGEKSGISEQDQLFLRKAGLSHVTAVSGMHIGFLVAFFYLLFGRKWGTVLSIGAILFFIPMAGASPSVIRAGIMYLIAALGFCLEKEHDSLNSLCIALVILLCINPYAIQSLSLQLSFAATLGLIQFSGRMQSFLLRPFSNWKKWARKAAHFLVSSIACSICAMAFTTPILFYALGYVSIFAPIANLLAVSIVGVLFVLGHLAGLAMFFPQTEALCTMILRPIASYVLSVAEFVSGLPYGVLYWENSYAVIALLALYAAIFWVLYRSEKPKPRLVTPALVGIFVTGLALGVWDARQTVTVSHLPSGAGQAILVSHMNQSVLIDCGASGYRNAAQSVQEYLLWNDISDIDTLILTAVDKTHARNAPELIRTTAIGEVIIPPQVRDTELFTDILQLCKEKSVPITVWEDIGEHELAGSPANSISIIGGVERKLSVRISTQSSDELIVHSLTQKMLEELLSKQDLKASTLVLAEGNIADHDKLRRALAAISPKEIILQSGYTDAEMLLGEYAIQNTYVHGEITWRNHAR